MFSHPCKLRFKLLKTVLKHKIPSAIGHWDGVHISFTKYFLGRFISCVRTILVKDPNVWCLRFGSLRVAPGLQVTCRNEMLPVVPLRCLTHRMTAQKKPLYLWTLWTGHSGGTPNDFSNSQFFSVLAYGTAVATRECLTPTR